MLKDERAAWEVAEWKVTALEAEWVAWNRRDRGEGRGVVLDLDDEDEGDEESGEDSKRDDQDEVAPVVAQSASAPESSSTLASHTPDLSQDP
ncbi:uncharacterized protein A4U43_C01F15690 [Asparagus officinalis]|uniref:Uncharacterized protein n=1 Tax=Asparagus officinalis TaxID=4686 RepID=A0A5P1FU73_ASPOF|nr:uncharacterized protein A4U43_C01F15690 [Asparagus officinalis]